MLRSIPHSVLALLPFGLGLGSPVAGIETAVPTTHEGRAASAERALESTFLLTVSHPDDKTGAQRYEQGRFVKCAVWIAPDRALTSLNGLEGAHRIECRVEGRKRSLELVASDRAIDLALLELKGDAREPGTHLELLRTEDEGLPEEGSLCFFSPVDPEEPELIPLSRLLDPSVGQLDLIEGERSRFLGGQPIVDGDGRLASLLVWAPAGTPVRTDRVLAGARIAALVDTAAGAKDGEVVELNRHERANPLALPVLDWSGSKTTARQAMDACRKFEDKVACAPCAGKGYRSVITKTQKGKRVTETEHREECKRCDGERIVKPKDLWSATRTLAAILAGAQEVEGTEDLKAQLENGVRKAGSLNLAEFRSRINDAAYEELDWKKVVPGRSVLFIVPEKSWDHDAFGGLGRDSLALTLKQNHLVLFDPNTRNLRGESSDVLVLGTTCGALSMDGVDYTLLDRVVAVPIRPLDDETGR